MIETPSLRSIGFRPREILAMINQEVIDQHAEEAAFLWTQRDHAVTAPQYALKHLAKLDERVEAHVDGLRVAASAGWTTAAANLEQGPGEAFAASVLAFESGDAERIDVVLKVGCSAPPLTRGLISALGWIEQDVAAREARKLIGSAEPEVRRAGIATMAVHRQDPGSLLNEAVVDPSPRVAARGMRAAAELGRGDLAVALSDRLSDADDECRFWAAWAVVRLRGRRMSDALSILRGFVESDGPKAESGVEIAFRAVDVAEGNSWRQRLGREPDTARLGMVAAGAIGDPAAVPDLLAQMANPELARVAGRAFSMITGADFDYEDLTGHAPAVPNADDDDDKLFSGPDSDLPWPSARAVQEWWSSRAARFVPGVRHLLGKPITDESLLDALARGCQNQRAAAALELALRNPSQVLFETRERAQRQWKKVAQWNS